MPATKEIKPALLNGLRTHLAAMAAYGQYKAGDTWYRSNIKSSMVRTNGSVEISILCKPIDIALTPATGFRILDENDNVLREDAGSMAFSSAEDEFAYRFKFGITAEQEGEI